MFASKSAPQEKDLATLIAEGSCDGVRKFFDDAFWRNQRVVVTDEHLKMALAQKNRPMVRLLSVWRSDVTKEEVDRLETEVASRTANSGEMVPGQGIFVGQWEPKDREGNSLRKIFNVYAAPEDLTGVEDRFSCFTFKEAVLRLSNLKDWHGHDGGCFPNDTAVYAALKNGNYRGEWFIPPRDLLHNLYEHRGRDCLSGTFNTIQADGGSGYPVWYWSSTEHRDYSSYVPVVRFSDGYEFWNHKDYGRLSCSPVRLVEASAPAPAPW